MKDLKSLYETDYALWLDRTIADLKERKLDSIDVENLLEEVNSLAGRERRELQSRLTTLLEHILKRRYLPMSECFRGWELTIKRSQIEIKKIIKASPSLKSYLIESLPECYQDALSLVETIYDHSFPEQYPFPIDPDRLLNDIFWE